MIKIRLDESNVVDESKAILPVQKIVDWYFDPANEGSWGHKKIRKILQNFGISDDELADSFSDLDWDARVDISRLVRGW